MAAENLDVRVERRLDVAVVLHARLNDTGIRQLLYGDIELREQNVGATEHQAAGVDLGSPEVHAALEEAAAQAGVHRDVDAVVALPVRPHVVGKRDETAALAELRRVQVVKPAHRVATAAR